MKLQRLYAYLLLLFIIPSLVAYPHASLFSQELKDIAREEIYAHPQTYDDVLKLIDDLESGELEKKYSGRDLDNLNSLLVSLAQEGLLPGEIEEEEVLENDIAYLLNGEGNSFEYAYQHALPPIGTNLGELLLCKNWFHKKWDQTKCFARKHKRALIIGAAVIVVATAVVLSAGVLSAPAAAAASAGAAASELDKEKATSSKEVDVTSFSQADESSPAIKSLAQEEIAVFKESLLNEHSIDYSRMGSLEENTRIQSSLFAHQRISDQFSSSPFAYEPAGDQSSQAAHAHHQVDKLFATECAPLYDTLQKADVDTLFYQVRGQRSLASGHLYEAVYDLGKAIELGPDRPLPHLERGLAHFSLGNYDASIDDYNNYVAITKPTLLPLLDFCKGFDKGVPKGLYASGEGYCLLASDLVKHPVQTSMQMWEAINTLCTLARSYEWSALCEALVPEFYQLIKDWDTLSIERRGELAGYALGKFGSDLIIPGALAKTIAKGVKGAQNLSIVYSGLKTAEKTLLLESAAAIGNGSSINEIIQATQRTVKLGEELGFGTSEMLELKQAGKFESTIIDHTEIIAKDPVLRQSVEKFKKAEKFLEPYRKEFLSEAKARQLIHQVRIHTFPKPAGVPENFRVKISTKGGMKYIHPTNPHITVRVMPGKPHSPFPYQQEPYVIQMKDGTAFDKFGKKINRNAPEAHIPIDEFIYRSN